MNRNLLIDLGVFALTLLTAGIHLYIGRFFGDTLLLLNGLGFLGLLVIAYIPLTKSLHLYARLALVLYTIVTILGYFVTHIGHMDMIGLGTKIVEIGLLVFLGLSVWGLMGKRQIGR